MSERKWCCICGAKIEAGSGYMLARDVLDKVLPAREVCSKCGERERELLQPAALASEQHLLLRMLERADVQRMMVIDTYSPNEATVTIENLQVGATRIDVVFQFEGGALKRIWAREG